uniref:hypothetical protein n=1 Tax=Cupriavidus necator TaxID=106590 RepID=UPI003F490757
MKFQQFFENDHLKPLYDHIRNLLLGAVLLAAGTFQTQHATRNPFDQIAGDFVGWGVIVIGAVLTVLNFIDGIVKLARFSHPLPYRLLLIVAYIILAARLVMVLWAFRSE